MSNRWHRLTSLAKLNLSSQSDSRCQPMLGELTNLRDLQLPYNRISDVSPLSRIDSSWKSLNLSQREPGGRYGSVRPNCRNLRRLTISGPIQLLI